MHRLPALFIWSVLLLLVPIGLGMWLRAGAQSRAFVAVTAVTFIAALAGGIFVGCTLRSMSDAVRGAVIGGGMLSLGVFIIPITVIDATSPACATYECDLGPSLGATAFFGIASLTLFAVLGIGYLLGLRQRNLVP